MNNFKPTFVDNQTEISSIEKQSDSTTRDYSSSPRKLDDLDVSNSSSVSSTSSSSKTNTKPIKNMQSPGSHLADFMNSVKFSNSEPNLSNHNSSNLSTKNSTTNRCSLVRQSISFNNEDDFEESLDHMKFDFDSKKENLNDTDDGKLDSNSKVITSRNGKIFNQVIFNVLFLVLQSG